MRETTLAVVLVLCAVALSLSVPGQRCQTDGERSWIGDACCELGTLSSECTKFDASCTGFTVPSGTPCIMRGVKSLEGVCDDNTGECTASEPAPGPIAHKNTALPFGLDERHNNQLSGPNWQCTREDPRDLCRSHAAHVLSVLRIGPGGDGCTEVADGDGNTCTGEQTTLSPAYTRRNRPRDSAVGDACPLGTCQPDGDGNYEKTKRLVCRRAGRDADLVLLRPRPDVAHYSFVSLDVINAFTGIDILPVLSSSTPTPTSTQDVFDVDGASGCTIISTIQCARDGSKRGRDIPTVPTGAAAVVSATHHIGRLNAIGWSKLPLDTPQGCVGQRISVDVSCPAGMYDAVVLRGSRYCNTDSACPDNAFCIDHQCVRKILAKNVTRAFVHAAFAMSFRNGAVWAAVNEACFVGGCTGFRRKTTNADTNTNTNTDGDLGKTWAMLERVAAGLALGDPACAECGSILLQESRDIFRDSCSSAGDDFCHIIAPVNDPCYTGVSSCRLGVCRHEYDHCNHQNGMVSVSTELVGVNNQQVSDPGEQMMIFLNAHLFEGTMLAWLAAPVLQYRDALRARGIGERIRISGADVVCLVEVWSERMKQLVADAAGDTHPHVWFPKVHASTRMIGTGTMFLSRAPLSGWRFSAFRNLRGLDRLSNKGVAAVRSNGVAYVVAHIVSDGDALGIAARQDNIAQIADMVRALQAEDPTAPVIVSGDFNTIEYAVVPPRPGDEPYAEYMHLRARMRETGLDDAFRAVHPDPAKAPGATLRSKRNTMMLHFARVHNRMDEDPIVWRIDHIFAPVAGQLRAIAAEVLEDWKVHDVLAPSPDMQTLDLSDHYPSSFTFRLPPQNVQS